MESEARWLDAAIASRLQSPKSDTKQCGFRLAMTTDRPSKNAAGAAPETPAKVSEELLRRLAHELRTPISAIASCAEVMRDEQFGPLGNEHYRDYADTIHSSADHVLGVIARTIGPGSDGQEDGNRFAAVDLDKLLDRATAMVSAAAADSDVTIERLPGHSPCTVETDATAMLQIALNLLSNAIKFTPPGGRVSVAVTQGQDTTPVVTVADTGIGIAPQELARIARGDGNGGLGLRISHALAAQCGATIAINSTRGEGTEVRVTFSGSHGATAKPSN